MSTAPFVYARIMGTPGVRRPLGYSDDALSVYGRQRARSRASGASPMASSTCSRAHLAGERPRDVYLYVISGHKVRIPRRRTALIRHLG